MSSYVATYAAHRVKLFVVVARKKKKGAADEPETLALQKAVDLDKAVKLILPVLSYDQVDPKNEKYKDLRKSKSTWTTGRTLANSLCQNLRRKGTRVINSGIKRPTRRTFTVDQVGSTATLSENGISSRVCITVELLFLAHDSFISAELGKTKTVVYGVAREEKAAIQQVVEQLSFKKVAIEEVPELFTSGKNLKDACEELYLGDYFLLFCSIPSLD